MFYETLSQGTGGAAMIDNFALGLIHFLLAVAVWRLLKRPDLDVEDPAQ